jgi:hypothetical protein
MNRDFEIVDNKVIVRTDNRNTVTREVTNNIEDILICENNIEEMDNKLQYYLDKTKHSKKKLKSGWSNLGLSALWFFTFVLNSISGNWFAASCNILCSICWFSMGYFETVRPELKCIKANKSVTKELEDNLKIEREKLKELNKDKTNDLMYIETDKKAINISDQIRNLKRKLDVIYSFEIHKTKLIRYYKKGVLKEKALTKFWFNDEDYCLLEELIKNELANTEEKKIGNQKVLKRR